MHRDAGGLQAIEQGIQQLAVVELALAGQVEALREPIAERRFDAGDVRAAQHFKRTQLRQGARGGAEQMLEAHRFGRVLAMPQHQRALLLEEHRPLERGDQFGPTLQGVGAHADHAQFRHRRFGQRREHRSGHMRRRAGRLGRGGVVNLDLDAAPQQLAGKQPAHQARAEDHRAIQATRRVHGVPSQRPAA